MKPRSRIALTALTGLAIAASTAPQPVSGDPLVTELSSARAISKSTTTWAQAPMWQQGRPKEMENLGLEPINPPAEPTPASQIPVDRVKLPPGFKIAIWADNVANAREIIRGTKGTIFVGSRSAGTVYAVVDKGTTRQVKTLANGLSQPNAVAFKESAPYLTQTHP